ncbi:carboxymuconolactone decarboxylase family protein [Chitinasiproducens palmae]|uniref:Alkyl hydroperoxide reductase AhpD n=1 Tax=Chitinasiproducens palmae TaxID=1770053 RepID=A0A1H2PTP9_9BURK|nr:carboxymuconolactone decarboxylase family protein [Chitinasiproducens palmae]SDV50483.1 alkyl hydroperoxide reductase subunit D [Chitinasiproducens palmae]
MEFLASIKELVPDYAKDIRLNVDSVIGRSSLQGSDAAGVALAAAFAAKSPKLVEIIRNAGVLAPEEVTAVLTASALMGMNNVYYPFVEMSGEASLRTAQAGLRMNAYATHGGVDKRRFELYALAASIIGKCHFCVKSHFENLVKEGMEVKQLQDAGRIASVINAVSQILVAEGK